MKSSKQIKLRVPLEAHFFYENDARHQGLSLNAYLNKKLEEKDILNQQFYHLHKAITNQKEIADSGSDSHDSVSSSMTDAIQLEILLLMRTISNPGNVSMIQSELKRLGYQPWSPKAE